ncbi:hypothetical protein Ciccas_011972 [Cichlidogyrus casuarinus]|uniref:[histone H4]-N-methyl-L-lysine(20) N-methyltransferase n=1 Tax=Cichlidogyrus casuarinus TaxID=1844966 RepID=A0ABD2PR31_9PLAT
MNWKELSEADDYASMLTVDAYLGFSTHKMTDFKVRLPERSKKKCKNIILNFKKDLNYEKAYSKLVEDGRYLTESLRQDPRFKLHIFRYLLLFDSRSGIEIRPCWRYASENHVGAAIFSTKEWDKGSKITTLIGCIAEMNLKEELGFLKYQKNDFSVMYSSRKNCSQLWLGPASFVNHDCKPNCKFTINCDGDARMSLEVKNPIKKGDEIYIYYGNHFFDVNNSICECFTCELLGQGFFSPDKARVLASPPKEAEPPAPRFLRKRANTLNDISKFNHALAPTAAALNGLLLKGSSTGVAVRVTSKAYSLRHTNSRLDRVKAQIYKETIDASAKSEQVSKCQKRRSLALNVESPTKQEVISIPSNDSVSMTERQSTSMPPPFQSPCPSNLDVVCVEDALTKPPKLRPAILTLAIAPEEDPLTEPQSALPEMDTCVKKRCHYEDSCLFREGNLLPPAGSFSKKARLQDTEPKPPRLPVPERCSVRRSLRQEERPPSIASSSTLSTQEAEAVSPPTLAQESELEEQEKGPPLKLARSRSLDDISARIECVFCFDRFRWPTQPPRISFWGYNDKPDDECSSPTAPGLLNENDSERTTSMRGDFNDMAPCSLDQGSSSPKTFLATAHAQHFNSPLSEVTATMPPFLRPVEEGELKPPKLVAEANNLMRSSSTHSRYSAPPVYEKRKSCSIFNSSNGNVALSNQSISSASTEETIRLTLTLKKSHSGGYYCVDSCQ